jgi:hypothetical protein
MTASSRSFLLFLLICLGGCAGAASGPQFSGSEVGADHGVIYVYALEGFAGYGESPIIEVDGRQIGKLQPKGFLAAKVAPGQHKVVMKSVIASIPMPGHVVPISVAAGHSAYLRVGTKYDGLSFSPSGPIPIYINVMAEVPPDAGMREIQSTRASTS